MSWLHAMNCGYSAMCVHQHRGLIIMRCPLTDVLDTTRVKHRKHTPVLLYLRVHLLAEQAPGSPD